MKYLVLISSVILLSACQKVIDVDLNESNPNIVIEANYMAKDSSVHVKISMTSSYFDSNPSPLVDDAVVTITDVNGTSVIVPSIGNGEYWLTGYVPVYNTNYIMTVEKSGITYTASCRMAEPVNLMPITYEVVPPGFFSNDTTYLVFLRYNDPADTLNFYEISLSKNGIAFDDLSDLYTQDDAFTDGNFVERPLFGGDFAFGDTVGMELRSIDEKVYNYINQAQSVLNSQNSAAPGNPTSNWDNDALGYFSAYSSSFQTVVLL